MRSATSSPEAELAGAQPSALSPQEANLCLGRKLRALRESVGLSQRELAKRAGLTNSSISTLEQGMVSPSVVSLERILAVFPISLADFFHWSEQLPSPVAVLREALIENAIYPKPGVSIQNLTPRLGRLRPALEMQRIRLMPGTQTDLSCAASGDILVAVVEGGAVLNTAGKPLPLYAGDSLCIPQKHYYCFRNTLAQPAELVLSFLLK